MIQVVYIKTNGGLLKAHFEIGSLLTNPVKYSYFITRIEGLSPPQAVISSVGNGTKNGSSVTGTRVSERNIVFDFVINPNKTAIEECRSDLYKLFPIGGQISMYFVTDTKTVKINGVVETCEVDIFSSRESAQVSVICPDPEFEELSRFDYDTDAEETKTEIITVSGSDGTGVTRESRFSTTFRTHNEITTGGIIEITVKRAPSFFMSAELILAIGYGNTEEISSDDTSSEWASGIKNARVLDLNINRFIGDYSDGVPSEVLVGDKIIVDTRTGMKSVTFVRDGKITDALSMCNRTEFPTFHPGYNNMRFNIIRQSYQGYEGLRADDFEIKFTVPMVYGGI